MADFTGERDRTLRIRKPVEVVFAKLTDPEVRASCMTDLERFERLDEGAVRWIMKEENQKGIRFRPDYTVRYEDNGKDSFSWRTVTGNPRSAGRGSVRAVGEDETEVVYHESITLDIPVPRLLAPVIRGLVSGQIASGVDRFLDSMKRTIERG